MSSPLERNVKITMSDILLRTFILHSRGKKNYKTWILCVPIKQRVAKDNLFEKFFLKVKITRDEMKGGKL